MNATAEKTEAKLMTGTSGYPKYFPFARKGNVLLGIKINGIAKGSYFGVPGTTYFAGRLRSAPENGLLADQQEGNVVKLEKNPENLWDAWPDVEWEKKDDTRASTTVGIFLRGSLGGDPEEQAKLANAVKDGELTQKMTDYLVGVAGEDNMIVPHRELRAWLDAQFGPIFDGVIQKVEQAKQVAAALEENIGVFGCQAAILKKAYGKTQDEDGGLVPAENHDSGHGDDDPVDSDHDGTGNLGQD
jgi:hypothetical protein